MLEYLFVKKMNNKFYGIIWNPFILGGQNKQL